MNIVGVPLFRTAWLMTAIALFLVQYIRPQEFVPALASLRPYAILMLATTGFLILSGQNLLQLKHVQMRLIWITLILMGIMVLFAKNHGYAFVTTNETIRLLPFILTILILVDDVKKLKIVINMLIAAGSFTAVRVFMTYTEFQRNVVFEDLGNFLADPNDLALFMNMMLPFAYFMFLNEAKWTAKKGLYLTASILIGTMTILTFSRGGFLGLLGVAFVMWYYGPNKALTAAIIGMATIIVVTLTADTWLQAMSTIDIESRTAQTRLNAWKASLEILIEHPLLGVGPNNVPMHLPYYVPYDGHWYGTVNHSVWLTALTESGLIGFTIFMFWVTYNFKDARKMCTVKPVDNETRFLRLIGAAFLASFTGYFISGTFLTVNYYPHFWYMTAILMVAVKIMYLREKDMQKAEVSYA